MDTVSIYTLPGRQRKLSLRFLTWFLLKKDIQTSMHDSIEDAKYALLLFRLYQRFVSEKRFDDVVEDIFHEGQKLVRCLEGGADGRASNRHLKSLLCRHIRESLIARRSMLHVTRASTPRGITRARRT